MQNQILIVTFLVMAVVGGVFYATVRATQSAPSGEGAEKKRKILLWSMVVFGVIISIGSLRVWPYKSAGESAIVVNVSGGQWWWEVDTYELPVGKEIEFRVTTEDVSHGMGIYSPDMVLLTQVQAMPGYENKLVYTFDEVGTYQVLCMEFCGVAHHDMINEFDVVEAE